MSQETFYWNISVETGWQDVPILNKFLQRTFISLTFVCPKAMVMAAAVVKLFMTGYDIKSTRNPER